MRRAVALPITARPVIAGKGDSTRRPRWAKRRRVVAVVAVAVGLTGCGSTVPLSAQSGLGQTTSGIGNESGAGSAVSGTGTVSGAGPAGSRLGPGTGVSGAVGSPGSAGGVLASGAASPTRVGSGPATVGATSGVIPLTGRGWDAKHVYIGVPTADDFNSTMANYGANFNNGNTEGDVDAIVADINKSGGIFGRQLVAVYHNTSSASIATDPSGTAQSMCTYFTQDQPVIAVVNGAPQFDSLTSFHSCLEHDSVSLLSFTNTDFDNQDYSSLGPNLWTVASLSTDILIPAFLAALNQQGFFRGWDTLDGTSGPAPTKVGILEPDTPEGQHVAALFTAQLKEISVPVASEFFYNSSGDSGDSANEVLQFKAAGVTHVLDLPPVESEVLFFQLAADQQHYRPRYGITSFDLPLSVQQNSQIVPPDQQIGSMGIGWQPYNDVDATRDPGALPGSSRCLNALSRGGQTFNSSQRRAASIAVQFCDAIYLLQEAAVAGKGLSASAILDGMALTGDHLGTAGTFGSDLSSQNHGVPGYYRDLQYQSGCSCFAYVGSNHPFTP